MLNYAAKYEPCAPADHGFDAAETLRLDRDIEALAAFASTRPINAAMPI
jgi:hypothetical protein